MGSHVAASLTQAISVLQVSGTEGPFGTSNIQEQLLPFDLSIFKSLHQVEVRPWALECRQG